MAEKLDSKFNWLKRLCNYFRENMPAISGAPQTLIHGEYYGKNILMKDNTVFPIDWETAAIAPGEIDLAALIDRKDVLRTNYAIESYKAVRWSHGQIIPTEFEKRLLMAKIFYQFKWITDWRLDFIELKKWLGNSNYYERLIEIGKQANCI